MDTSAHDTRYGNTIIPIFQVWTSPQSAKAVEYDAEFEILTSQEDIDEIEGKIGSLK